MIIIRSQFFIFDVSQVALENWYHGTLSLAKWLSVVPQLSTTTRTLIYLHPMNYMTICLYVYMSMYIYIYIYLYHKANRQTSKPSTYPSVIKHGWDFGSGPEGWWDWCHPDVWFRDSVKISFLWSPYFWRVNIRDIRKKSSCFTWLYISSIPGYASRNHWQRHFLSEGSQLVPLQWRFCELQRWRMMLAMGHLCSWVCLNWLCFFLNRTPKSAPIAHNIIHLNSIHRMCLLYHIKYPLVN